MPRPPLRALLLLAWIAAAPVVAAQGATRVALAPEGAGAEGFARAVGAAAERLLASDFASCLARLGGDGEAATHRAVLTVAEGADGPTWTLALVADPGGEVVAEASGQGGAEAAAEEAARAILAPLCEVADGAAGSAWEASGGGAEIAVSGRIASLEEVFTLEGVFPGGTAVFTYTPVSPGGGAVEYEAAGSGVTASGEGLYSLTPQGDGTILLEQTTDGCVHGVPNSCRTNTERITLTPVPR